MKLTMTYELAMAAGRDAANAQARNNGRKAWSVDDYNLAVEVFNRLWPKELVTT